MQAEALRFCCASQGCSGLCAPWAQAGEFCPLCSRAEALRREVKTLDKESEVARALEHLLDGCLRLAQSENLELAIATGQVGPYLTDHPHLQDGE